MRRCLMQPDVYKSPKTNASIFNPFKRQCSFEDKEVQGSKKMGGPFEHPQETCKLIDMKWMEAEF